MHLLQRIDLRVLKVLDALNGCAAPAIVVKYVTRFASAAMRIARASLISPRDSLLVVITS